MFLNFILTVVVVIFPLVFYIKGLQMSSRQMPPGPFVLPVVGSLPAMWLQKPIYSLKRDLCDCFQIISAHHGGMFSFSVANFNFLVISSYEIFKEVADMDEYGCKFAHKNITYARTFGKELGVFFANSPPLWSEMRKFTVRTLREFGFGKEYTMHSIITEEASLLIENLKTTMARNNGVVKFQTVFSPAVLL